MPEGDTIHRAARTLQQAIGGREVTSFETVLPALARIVEDSPIIGRKVDAVTAIGKHLLITFSGGVVLRSHMRMNGSWHIYRPGERWQRPRIDMRVLIGTVDWLAVGFNLPVAELVAVSDLARNEPLSRLGPDLLSEELDGEEARRRIRASAQDAIADALLDQTAVAGVGNVYKSEVLFLHGINPFLAQAALSDDEIDAIVSTARRLMRHNVERADAGRETRQGARKNERLWVYGKEGRACRRCGTPVLMRKQGRHARVTFWCPHCQPER